MRKRICLVCIGIIICVVSAFTYVPNVNASDLERGGGGNECYQYVKNIQQTKNYNCGTTTVLQTLYGMGFSNNVPGNTDADKLDYLDSVYHVDELGQSDLNQLVYALNNHITGLRTYQVFYNDPDIKIDVFEDMIARSLMECKPVVALVDTSYLSYYNGNSYGHYVSVDYINRTTNTVRIVDCNFMSAYYGVHYVSLTELYNATLDGAIIY